MTLRSCLAPAVLAALASGPALAQSYRFRVIARTGDTIAGYELTGVVAAPSLNKRGAVAYGAEISGGVGLFINDTTLVVKTGDTVGGQTINFLTEPSINNRGRVAYGSFVSGHPAIFLDDTTYVSGPGSVVAGKKLVGATDEPKLNDDGAVVYSAAIDPPGLGVFIGAATLVVETGDTVDGRTLMGVHAPSINDDGAVAYVGTFAGGSGVFIDDTTLVAKVGDTVDGKVLEGLGDTVLNDAYSVAYWGSFDTSGSGVFIDDSTLVAGAGETVAGRTLTSVGPFFSYNNIGSTAFIGEFAGGEGVFIDDRLVLSTGESVGGNTVEGIDWPSLNDRGDMAFAVRLNDGSRAIVCAVRVGPKVPDAVLARRCGGAH